MQIIPEIKDGYVINDGVFYLLGVMVVVPFEFYLNSINFWMFMFKPPGRHPWQPGTKPPFDNKTALYNFYIKERVNYFNYQTYNGSKEYSILEIDNLWPYTTTLRYNDWLNFTNDSTIPDQRSLIQANFTGGFTVAFIVALLGALLICSFWKDKLPRPEQRLKWSLIALCILFSLNTLATQINSRQVIKWFFVGILLFSTLMNFCTGMAMASLYELISKFPPTYYASIQSGHKICGILSSVVQVILLSAMLRPHVHGAIYFACGTVILIVTTIYYIITIKNSKYFIYKIKQNDRERRISRVKYAEVLLKIKWFYVTLIFVEATTHVVYPGLAALVVPYYREPNNVWKEIYFVPVITFLGFQVCNLIGREAARIIKTPKHGIVLFILATLRIALAPLLIFCNALPRCHLPVIFEDNAFITFIVILAFSEGILANMVIVAIPTILDKDDREAIMVLVPLISAITVTLASTFNLFITNLI